ncbi:MAG: D-2-hydroxyacid dehydrogenase [Planctomycetota bacterium]
MPKIVALDGFCLTPATTTHTPANEPTWDALTQLGDLTVYPRTAPDEIVERCQDAELMLTNKVPFNADTLAQLPNLQYLGVTATGVNIIDLDAAKARGITVTNVPAYSTASVAQHVFALILSLNTALSETGQAVRDGQWANGPDFSFTLQPWHELEGQTLGIVGMGTIGQAVARLGHAFGMHIAAHSRTPKTLDIPVAWLSLDNLFQTANVVSLHCPLTPKTQHLANAERFASMKPNAIFINTGRGPLVDEPALADALAQGTPAAAGLDVLSQEPPAADNPLLSAPNCLITPHLAWASVEARHRCMATVTDNVAQFLQGQPVNVVS